MELNVCEWKWDDDGYYETECSNTFSFTEGALSDNKFIYCPYCGCKIKEQA